MASYCWDYWPYVHHCLSLKPLFYNIFHDIYFCSKLLFTYSDNLFKGHLLIFRFVEFYRTRNKDLLINFFDMLEFNCRAPRYIIFVRFIWRYFSHIVWHCQILVYLNYRPFFVFIVLHHTIICPPISRTTIPRDSPYCLDCFIFVKSKVENMNSTHVW